MIKTFTELKNLFTAAGLADYATQMADPDQGHVAFVDFRDLPEEGTNPVLDGTIRALQFDMADKGLLFTGRTV